MAANQASIETDKITAVQHSPASGASTPSRSSDLDDDYHLYKRGDDQELGLAESKRVLRKLDRRIVPILFFIYLLQYLDKNGINYASVYGLQKGTHLHGDNYNWLGSIFYFAQSLIGYAVGHITTGLPRWMYVFLIFGSLSITMGIIALIFLPDQPSTAKFLNDAEKVIAAKRVSANRQGIKNRHFKSYQVWQTIKDPKTWILFVMAVGAQIPNAAITQFTSLVIKSFNVSTLGTQYLQIPGGAIQFLALIGGGFICSKWPNLRCPTMIVANTICIIGAGLLVGLPNSNKWGRLVGLWLCFFQGLGFSMSLTMVSSNIAGYTKKQLTAAVLFTGYCVGNIIGPQTFKSSDAPAYHSAYVAMLIGYIIKLVSIIVLYVFMYLSNKKRDREAAASGIGLTDEEKEAIERGMHDMTELDNKGFRYSL
ncbi:hypothetical protein H2200_005735 [Cladophialophora chaetospira]|uniref:Transporter n=1 Tax=Cladophialophora chaetospira TaxID=386627 RepID=A0AA38XA76_9EURO|nr:hypothetical protein H2200_005735 [Cladophialophora chaetospira]